MLIPYWLARGVNREATGYAVSILMVLFDRGSFAWVIKLKLGYTAKQLFVR